MKTSKIIILSIFATIIIWITILFFTATSKIKYLLKENGFEQTNKKIEVDKGETLKLDNFSVIVLSGKGEITAEQSDHNSFQYFSENGNKPEVKNDTLFFDVDGKNKYIYAKNLRTVLISEKVKFDLIDFQSDTFNIKTSDKSHTEINGLRVKTLNIFTKNNSSVELYNLKNQNIKSELILKDKSKLYIDDAGNLNLNIEKDSDAKLEISN